MNLFSTVELAPRDPILGLTEAFNADHRQNKVNLGIGIYTNEDGKIPLLRAVHEAERMQCDAASPRGYLPIDGLRAYHQAVQKLLFGEGSPALQKNRIVTVQTLGGTGALRTGADFLKRLIPNTNKTHKIAISNPSWENHRALFEAAGFDVITYPYYDAATHGIDFDGLTDALNTYAPRTIVLFHACCHNPTGVDLTIPQWQKIIEIVKERELVPFLDIAYQGFSNGIDADAAAVRLFSDESLPTFVANSFSKTFSLYGERVGALSVITSTEEEAARVLSQLKRVIRTTYSNPPTHGAAVVAKVLSDAALRAQWEYELNEMRERICAMRGALVGKLKHKHLGADRDFEFINHQRGMFSYSGLNAQQVKQLQSEFGIYAVSTGRICIAALNNKNLDSVANAIAQVL